MASSDTALGAELEMIPSNAGASEVDEEKAGCIDEVNVADCWTPKQLNPDGSKLEIVFLDLLKRIISHNPPNPPNITWASGKTTGFFRVPTTNEIVSSALTSSTSPLATAFSYFVFVMTYMSKITLRRAPSDESSELFFLIGLFAASASPLVFCLILLVQRLEYAGKTKIHKFHTCIFGRS